MSRKVFVSFLGTNNYIQTCYDIDGNISRPVRFIQEALVDYLCSEWTEEDKIFIFYTELSKAKNWDDNGQTFVLEDQTLESIGLESILNKKNLRCPIEGVLIKEGFSEGDVWDIFNVVYSCLQEGDNVYLDVTHAFRTIPLFSTVLMNYSHFMKGTTLQSIHYGAFEKLGSARDVKLLPVEQRIAPVINLGSVIQLQQFTTLANEFISYGHMRSLSGSLGSVSPSVKQFRALVAIIITFDNAIVSNRIQRIQNGEWYKDFVACMRKIRKSPDLPKPCLLVLDRLADALNDFVPEYSLQNIEAAIKWTVRYNMLPQICTFQQEYIITLVYNILSKHNPYITDQKNSERLFREYISALLGFDDTNKDFKLTGCLAENEVLTNTFIKYQWIKEVRKYYKRLSTTRNIINHGKVECESNQKASDANASMMKTLVSNYESCIKVLREVKEGKYVC